MIVQFSSVQCCFTSRETIRLIRDGKNNCLYVSVLCFGTCRWSGRRRRWYGLVEGTSGGGGGGGKMFIFK